MALGDYSSVGSTTHTNPSGITVETPYEDKDELISVDSFLQLMIAEMTSTSPFGDEGGGGSSSTNYITQLAQITTMQQMQQLAYYSKSNYVMSLVGKTVTAASLGLGGKTNKVTGTVEKIGFVDKDFLIYVDGKGYKLNQIMSVNNPDYTEDQSGLDELKKTNLVFVSRTDTEARIRWDEPNAGDDVLKTLKYSVYYSTDKDMDTAAAVKKGTLAGTMDASKMTGSDKLVMDLKNLKPGTTYYTNVLVTTTDGKEYIYKKLSFTTKGNASTEDGEDVV